MTDIPFRCLQTYDLTPVRIDVAPRKLLTRFDEGMVTFGSCFAKSFKDFGDPLGLSVYYHPAFSFHYNPVTLASYIEKTFHQHTFTSDDLLTVAGSDIVFLPYGNVAMNGPDSADVLCEMANTSAKELREFLTEASVVIITLGTATCVNDVATGRTLVKNYSGRYEGLSFHQLSVGDVCDALTNVMEMIRSISNTSPAFVLTVSPQRYNWQYKPGADPVVYNCHDKSLLRVAAAELADDRQVHYFPAYEIAIDELRHQEHFSWPDHQHVHFPATPFHIFDRFMKTYADAPLYESVSAMIRLFRNLEAAESTPGMLLPKTVGYFERDFDTLKRTCPETSLPTVFSQFIGRLTRLPGTEALAEKANALLEKNAGGDGV